MTLPDCPHCAIPIGDGDCLGCRNIRGQEVDTAQDAIDFAPVDAEWMERKLGEEWRDSMGLRGLVVLADKALAANPLNATAVDRLVSECSDDERDSVARFRYMLVLGAVTCALAEWAQTSGLLLPDPDDLPHWLAT